MDIAQIYYLQKVLGLRGVILPKGPDWLMSWPNERARLLLVGKHPTFEPEQPFFGEGRQLLQRMCEALQIPWAQVALWQQGAGSAEEAALFKGEVAARDPQAILFFGGSPLMDIPVTRETVFYWKNKKCLAISEIETLLLQPSERKRIWPPLQTFIS